MKTWFGSKAFAETKALVRGPRGRIAPLRGWSEEKNYPITSLSKKIAF